MTEENEWERRTDREKDNKEVHRTGKEEMKGAMKKIKSEKAVGPVTYL